MLNVKNLNKYFFKKKSNEIHVLKDVCLHFEDKGLYFLLGPSGSGKSTLLNCIGLLDSFDSGEISIEDKTFTKYKKVDDIRNLYFGYVFQNYLLNEEQTVYENLAIVLKLINYKGDYYKRCEEVLKAVGMEKYIKRRAKDLSGGQKQRIGIARCLIKSPKIILMDEPTGNLDEKNSIQVMEIAKSLAKQCLIICVSHDENLANAYGDYIIRLKDGQITSINKNNDQHRISVNDSNHIFLKDYDLQNVNNINIYSNTTLPKLDIIIDHNIVFIRGNQDIEVINDTSKIKLVNEHKQIVPEKSDDFEIEISEIKEKESKHVLSFFSLFKKAFKNNYKKLTKIAFILTSIFFANHLPFLSTLQSVDELKFVESHSDVYYLESINPNSDFISFLTDDDVLINARYATSYAYINNKDNPFYSDVYLNGSYVPKKENMKFKYGQESDNRFDIYIDEVTADRIIQRNEITSFGINEPKDFIGLEVTYTDYLFKGKVAGIVETREPAIYVDKDLLFLTRNFAPISYDFLYDEITYFDSKTKLNENEFLVNEKYLDRINIDGTELGKVDVVGTFTSPYDVKYIANNNTYNQTYGKIASSYYLYTNNINRFIDKYSVNNFRNYRDVEVEEYHFMTNITVISNTIFLVITLVVSLLFLYFIMRSSLIHRIKEVGINRSIGVKKFDIYKIFGSEILAIVIKYSLPGYLITNGIMIYLHNGGLIPEFNIGLVFFGFIFYLVLAIIIGLIPVFALLRKTPSEINKKYDI